MIVGHCVNPFAEAAPIAAFPATHSGAPGRPAPLGP